MRFFAPSRLRALALVAVSAVTGSLLLAFVPAAYADTNPAAGTPATVTSTPLATAQVNGVVWAQHVAGDTVYVGGEFTQAQPAGAAAGVDATARTNLLAYNLTTGVLSTAWVPTANGQVRDIASSPDGSVIYLAGDFSTVNGTARSRLAAVSAANGALVAGFAPAVNASVYTVDTSGATVYFGGIFTAVGGTARPRAAAVAASNGALTAWSPQIADFAVRGLEVSPAGDKVVLAGSFSNINGPADPNGTNTAAQHGMGAVDAGTGATMTWTANGTIINFGANAAIYSISSDADNVYGVGYYLQGQGRGVLEGTFNAGWSSGQINWIADCHGDSYGVASLGDVVYVAGHSHYCYNLAGGGLPQATPVLYQRGIAFTKVATGVLDPNSVVQPAYVNLGGQPSPTMLTWYPDINSGTYTGQDQGAWSIATAGGYVLYGGEFTQVNGTRQTGLVRFGPSTVAPNTDGPRLAGPDFAPDVRSLAPGTARVSWLANYDRDNQNLTYQVLRGGTVVHTMTGASRIWYERPTFSFTDTGLTPGANYSYSVRATDPRGNSATGSAVGVTIATTDRASDYADAVLADGAESYWRFSTPTGGAVDDIAGVRDLSVGSGVSFGSAGAIVGDADGAATFSGESSGTTSTQGWLPGTNRFALEAWFRTSSSTGGKILGFNGSSTGAGRTHDREIFLDAGGRLYFAVNNGAERTISSPSAGYNDGRWHHVASSLGADGMRLYVDGQLVGSNTAVTTAMGITGYWRVGGDGATTSPTQVLDPWFDGQIDDVAVYGAPLAAADVAAHHSLGSAGRSGNVAPLAAATVAMSNLTGTFTGTGSSDPDGIIAGYVWTFGDGTTATGATATHSYPAAGTYTARLSVTDDHGATDSTSFAVTALAASDIARDSFSRDVVGGLGASEKGGPWQVTGGAVNVSATGGRAEFSTPAGITLNGYLGAVSSSDTDLQFQTSLLDAPTGSGATFVAYGRRISRPQSQPSAFSGDYRLRTTINAAGAVTLSLQRQSTDANGVSSTASLTSSTIAGLTYSAGQVLNHRFQVTGTSPTTLRAKVWRADSSEPTAWTIATTDATSGAQVAGSVGLGTFLSGSATNTPTTFTFDNFVVTPTNLSNTAPSAVFTRTVSALTASFDSSGSSDAGGSITSYLWNFGDGTSSTVQNPVHAYAAAGSYPVTLTVTDNVGLTGSTTQTVTVADATPVNASPVAAFTATANDLVLALDAGGSTDGDGAVTGFAWNFGDGTTGAGVTTSKIYAAPGIYSVTLTVTDDDGATDTETRSVTVSQSAPPAGGTLASDAFGRTVTNGLGSADAGGAWTLAGSAAGFSVSGGAGRLSAAPGATLTGYLGAVASTDTDVRATVTLLQNPTGGGVYASVLGRRIGSADYRARLVISSAGAINLQLQRSGTTLVSARPAGVTALAGQAVTVRVQTTGTAPTTIRAKVWANGAAEPAAWQLTTTDTLAALQANGSVGIQHYLSGSATANPTVLTVDDLTVTTTSAGTPANTPPTASFTAAATGLQVSVNAAASTDSDGTIASYAWNWGDGTPAGAGATATHSYGAAGTYTVTLTATDDDGGAATTTRSVTVSAGTPANAPPTASFTAAATGLTVTVNGSGSTDSDGTIAAHAWNWGDGTAAGTGATATHAFAAAGTYTVTLRVTDDDGATDDTTRTVTVAAAGSPSTSAEDAFERVVTGGLGTAVKGGAWTLSGGNANFSVAGGTSRWSTAAGRTLRAYLTGASGTSADVSTVVALQSAPSGSGIYGYVVGRRVGTADYGARIKVNATGTVDLQLAATDTTLSTLRVPGLTYAAGNRLNLRVQVFGTSPTTIRAKVWPVGSAEPSAWQVSATNSVAGLQGAGYPGLGTYASGSSAATTVVTFDDFTVRPVQ
ncbi:MAG: cell surface protein [Naasia sp.]|nr:cell surface protein [Naasia sp.]